MGSLRPHGLSGGPSPPFMVPETPAGSGSSQGPKFLGSPLQDGASIRAMLRNFLKFVFAHVVLIYVTPC